MGGTLGSRVTGLLRSAVLFQFFDKGLTDAFLVALRIPNLFRELLAEGALTNAFVPIYKSLSPLEAKRLSSALLSLLLLVNSLLVLLAVWAAPWIVDLLLGSGGNINRELTVTLTRIVFPFLTAISLSALAMGILQAEERFFAPAWAPVALNVVTVVLMLLFPGQAVPLAVAFVLGGVAQFAVQIPSLVRSNLLPKLGAWWHPELAAVLVLMGPFTFTTGARQFLNLAAVRVLDALPDGSVTAFEGANLFMSLALGLFSISPALAYYSRLSADAVGAPESFPKTLLTGVKLISFLTVPAGVALLLLAAPAVQSVLNWMSAVRPTGGMEPAVVRLSVLALAPLGLAVFPVGVSNLLIRTFYVRRRIRTPVIISFVFILLNALLYFVLARPLGIAGLSWATVVVGWLQFVTLLVVVSRMEPFDLPAFLSHALRVWLAAGVAAGATGLALWWVPFPAGWWGFLTQACLGLGVLGSVYAGMSLALGLPELAGLRGRFRR